MSPLHQLTLAAEIIFMIRWRTVNYPGPSSKHTQMENKFEESILLAEQLHRPQRFLVYLPPIQLAPFYQINRNGKEVMFKKAGNDSVKINWSLQSVTWKWKIYLEILNECDARF